jgi:ribosome recycling factor
MEEQIKQIISKAQDSMKKAIAHLEDELVKIRAGKASPSMLDSVKVDYYGTMTPLSQVANVNTPDPKTITVQAWEKKLLDPIEKAIQYANLGLNPQNNGDLIIISVPPLTEERRKDLVKKAKAEGEHAKVGIRNARKDANDEIKKLQKDGLSEDLAKDAEAKVQKMTDEYNSKADAEIVRKEKDILTI